MANLMDRTPEEATITMDKTTDGMPTGTKWKWTNDERAERRRWDEYTRLLRARLTQDLDVRRPQMKK